MSTATKFIAGGAALAIAACSILTNVDGIAGSPSAALEAGSEAAASVSDGASEAGSSKSDAYRAAVRAEAPRAYFPLDEPSGARLVRDAISGKAFVVLGEPQFGSSGVAGTAARFERGSGIDLEDTFDLVGDKPFSIELWMKAVVADGLYHSLLTKRGASEPFEGWTVYVTRRDTNGALRVTMERDWLPSVKQFAWTDFQNAERMMHVVFTLDQTGLKSYLDGRGSGNGADPRPKEGPPDTPLSLQFAMTFVGTIDELAFYDHALTPERIVQHFEIGR